MNKYGKLCIPVNRMFSITKRFFLAVVKILTAILFVYAVFSLFGMMVDVILYSSYSHRWTREQYVDSATELQSFNRLMNSWEFTGKPYALIYFLLSAKNSNVFKHFALRRLNFFFNARYQYPIIVFHESDFPNSEKNDIKLRSESPIFFQEINFAIPDVVTEPPEVFLKRCGFPPFVGYRHMCRFHTRLVFEHPVMQKVDYYMRLDHDSVIFSTINYDMFSFMETNQIEYGYALPDKEHLICIRGLHDTVDKFINSSKIQPGNFRNWSETDIFYNNFEIASVKFWKQPKVWEFIKHIDASGGIYYYRWGDAPIHTYAVQIFAKQDTIHQFSDLYYKHQMIHSHSLAYYNLFCYFDEYLRMTVWKIVRYKLLFMLLYVVLWFFMFYRRKISE